MYISEQDKKAIDEAVQELHYVQTDAHGQKYIERFANYNDTNEGLLQDAYDHQRLGFTSQDNPQHALLDLLREKIDGWYTDTSWDMEDDIIRKAGFDPADDRAAEQLEYLRETYPFVPDYDHFLDQSMKVNIMLATPSEQNSRYDVINTQYLAMSDPDQLTSRGREDLQAESGLSWFLTQQGHTMAELQQTLKEYHAFFESPEAEALNGYDAKYEAFCKTHNPFLASVCQELENQNYSMGVMTILANMSMKEFADFMQPGKELVLPKDAMVGIFNPWNGSGSVLEIELEKDLVVPSGLVYDAQIEGAKPDRQYGLNDCFGLVGSAWKDVKAVQDAQPAKAGPLPSLASKIASAESRRCAPAQSPTHAPEKEPRPQGRY